ncbi:MAG: hypothetical protein ACJA2Y_001409 [Cycloclasticus pugetii]|jgi:hypothetical protein
MLLTKIEVLRQFKKPLHNNSYAQRSDEFLMILGTSAKWAEDLDIGLIQLVIDKRLLNQKGLSI